MTGNLYIQSQSLSVAVPAAHLQRHDEPHCVRGISYAGASSFSSWDDSSGNNRRMLEVRNRSYESSRDNAVLLRDVVNGTYYAYPHFSRRHGNAGARRQRRHRGKQRQGRAQQPRNLLRGHAAQHRHGRADLPRAGVRRRAHGDVHSHGQQQYRPSVTHSTAPPRGTGARPMARVRARIRAHPPAAPAWASWCFPARARR